MIRCLFFAFFLLAFSLKAQNLEKVNKRIEQSWSGTIVLDDGQEYRCAFTYNPLLPGGLLIVKTDSVTHIYPPEKIQGFYFFDDELKCTRNFYSLPFKIGDKDKHFFELLHETGQISILGSSTVENRSRHYNQKIIGGLFYDVALKKNDHSSVTRTKVKNQYRRYLLDHRDNTIYDFSMGELLRMTQDRSAEIQAFRQQNHFRKDQQSMDEYIAIIDYYTSIKN